MPLIDNSGSISISFPSPADLGAEPLGAEARAKQYTDEEIAAIVFPPAPTLAELGGEPAGAETRAKQYTDEEIAAIVFPPAPTLAELGGEPAGAETRAKAYADQKVGAVESRTTIVESRTLVTGLAGLVANNSIASSNLNISISGTKYVATRSFTCSSLQILLSAGGTGKLKLAIYKLETDNSLTKLSESVERISVPVGLQTFNLASNVSITQGTTYFVCAFSDSGNYAISASAYSTAAYFFASSLNVYATGYPASILANKRTHYDIQLCLSVIDVEDVNKTVATLRDTTVPALTNRVGVLEAVNSASRILALETANTDLIARVKQLESDYPNHRTHFWGHGKSYNGLTEKTFSYNTANNYDFYRYAWLNNPTLGDTTEFDMVLRPGTYKIRVIHDKDTDRGIANFYVNNVSVGSVDCYSQTKININRFSANSFTVTKAGTQTFKCVITGKNPSSTGFAFGAVVVFIHPVWTSKETLINSGNLTTPYISTDGRQWMIDQFFSGGSANILENAIGAFTVSGTTEQTLYKTEREGTFSYTLPNVSGVYTLRLHFCENWFSAAGQRVGGVGLNGSPILTNFDIFAQAGGKHKALVKEFKDLNLTACALNFSTTIVNAIELIKQ